MDSDSGSWRNLLSLRNVDHQHAHGGAGEIKSDTARLALANANLFLINEPLAE
jgi:hypothetical protein